MWRGSQCGKIPWWARGISGVYAGGPDARRHGLRARIPGRAVVPRIDPCPHFAHYGRVDVVVYCRTCAGSTEVLLRTKAEAVCCCFRARVMAAWPGNGDGEI